MTAKDCKQLFSSLVGAPGYVSHGNSSGIPDNLDQQIDWFEGRIQHWILDYAQYFITHSDSRLRNDSGYAILALLNSYPELIAKLHDSDDDKLVSYGLLKIFPEIDKMEEKEEVLDILYKNYRNSIAHTLLPDKEIILSNDYPNLTICVNKKLICVVINPTEWVNRIDQHFKQYLKDLRNAENRDLRNTFSQAFNKLLAGQR